MGGDGAREVFKGGVQNYMNYMLNKEKITMSYYEKSDLQVSVIPVRSDLGNNRACCRN
jgi:hypothetical protein